MNKKQQLLIIGCSLLLLLIIATNKEPTTVNTQPSLWQEAYQATAKESLASYEVDIGNTDYYDLDDQAIAFVATSIAEESESVDEAIRKTLQHVNRQTVYEYNEPDSACLQGTAPQILASGSGQCDTQSIAVIAILRKMGIAAKPVGGCIIRNPGCGFQALFVPGPKYTELSTTDLEEVNGRRGGGLHAWVVAWTPTDGWLTLEATTGTVANTECYTYHVELYPADNNKAAICTSTNIKYAQACALGDITNLNAEGLGKTGEVSP